MASPPFPLEDQTDEDFFDKLVEDEGDASGSSLTVAEHRESVEVLAFGELGIGEAGTSGDGFDSVDGFEGAFGEECVKDDVGSYPVGPSCDSIGPAEAAIESVEENQSGENESSNCVEGVDGINDALNSMAINERKEGGGIKQVQWSAFGSDLNDDLGNDFFSGIEGNFEDSFGQVSEFSMVGSYGVTGSLSATAEIPEIPSLSSHLQPDDNPSNDVYAENNSYAAHEENQNVATYTQNNSEVQDVNSIEYWESQNPGWRYDRSTGQWHKVDGSDPITNNQENGSAISQSAGEVNVAEQQTNDSYLQHTFQPAMENVIQGSSSDNVAYWDQTSVETHNYPSNMVFDPQYPTWYYDTIAQEWREMKSYNAALNQVQSLDHSQALQNGSALADHYQENHVGYGQHGDGNYSQIQDQAVDNVNFVNGYNEQTTDMLKNELLPEFPQASFPTQPLDMNSYVQSGHVDSIDRTHVVDPSAVNFVANRGFDGSNGFYGNQLFVQNQSGHVQDSTKSREVHMLPTAPTFSDQTNWTSGGSNGVYGFQGFVPAQPVDLNHNKHNNELNYQSQFSPTTLYGNDFSNYSNQPLERGSQIPYTPTEGRSPDGRPPHALVAFGFGGKFIVMKDHLSSAESSFGIQDSAGPVVNVLNLMEVVMPKRDGTNVGFTGSDYFHSLCSQSFPGPLVSGNVGNKELNKWIDDKAANGGIQENDYAKAELTRMLFSLLKIACQYYGKLRTPFGTDHGLKEGDCPESALAKLFASAKGNGAQLTQYGALTNCLQNLPSVEQIQATAVEVEKLLVTGRKIEALQCAQEGQLWGLAVVIAAQLGDLYYSETVKQMAIHQLVAGGPLRTLCLLIAGQPAEVFSNSATSLNQSNPINGSMPAQMGSNCMLDQWEENLAIITANRTKGDELVITHLGDCLWKDRGQVTAAHICYLVAEANIEPFSDSARLCLIGADHWKNPRTFSTPDAIQRTELFEYTKVLGNSQSLLLPFQPYKIVYANMLAEVGKLSESMKYCQAILKSLKTGRSPEVEAWRNLVSSLEERIKIHQQGGYAANLAPGKLYGKLRNLFDSTAQRVVGLPPPAPSASASDGQHTTNDYQSRGNRVSTSQSTVAMSSLTSSASQEPINDWSGSSNRKLHNRSASEPDIGRTPRKVHSPDNSTSSTSSGSQESTSGSAVPSRFGRFGSQIFQKTVGLVLGARSGNQAKLGETNKFYYDEKLKRWVEEGVKPSLEETALPPPPTAAFMNGMPDQHMKDGSAPATFHANAEPQFKSPEPAERSSVMPPISPAMNQFSSRGRVGVRSRYVDTFNKGGGGPANSFQSPSLTATKPAGFANAKFFMPSPVPAGEETPQINESEPKPPMSEFTSTLPDQSNTFLPTPPEPHRYSPTVALQRQQSLDNLVANKRIMIPNGDSSSFQHSRRTASWSGANPGDNLMHHPNKVEPQAFGGTLGIPPNIYKPSEQLHGHAGEDLHEVEL